MKKFHLHIVAVIQFSSFAITSGSSASTHDRLGIAETVDHSRFDETSEMRLPLFSGTATSSTCEVTVAAESGEMNTPFHGADNIPPDEPDGAMLNWLENEMQMSIDPRNEPQAIIPDFTCMDPPHNCPANVKSEFLPGAVCVVTSCGLGACPSCPSFIPNLAIKAWCAYGCMKGSKVVGGCFGFWTRIGNRWLGPYCFAG